MLLDRRIRKRELMRTITEFKVIKSPKAALKFKAPASSVKTTLLDISIGGCALESPCMIPPSVHIAVKIDPLAFAIQASQTRKEPLEMTGRVTSCIRKNANHYRLGICFIRIKKKDSDLIKRFIRFKERRKFPRWDMTES